jgi:hypothetical protein
VAVVPPVDGDGMGMGWGWDGDGMGGLYIPCTHDDQVELSLYIYLSLTCIYCSSLVSLCHQKHSPLSE